jgi:hypothetical protein
MAHAQGVSPTATAAPITTVLEAPPPVTKDANIDIISEDGDVEIDVTVQPETEQLPQLKRARETDHEMLAGADPHERSDTPPKRARVEEDLTPTTLPPRVRQRSQYQASDGPTYDTNKGMVSHQGNVDVEAVERGYNPAAVPRLQ